MKRGRIDKKDQGDHKTKTVKVVPAFMHGYDKQEFAQVRGRPSLFSDSVADQICQRLADGESLRAICSGDEMPAQSTVYKWLNAREDFVDKYARARELQADAIFDELLDIADDGTNDWMARTTANGTEVEVLNAEHVQRSRLRIDARKWVASKLAPKKYGDKMNLEHTGPEGGPMEITFVRQDGG